MATKFATNPLDYHAWGVMLGRYQKYMPKLTNTAKMKSTLLSRGMVKMAADQNGDSQKKTATAKSL